MAPALRLIRPKGIFFYTTRHALKALAALLSLLANVAQGQPAMAGLVFAACSTYPKDSCSLCELLEAAGDGLHACSKLEVVLAGAGDPLLNPADRLGALLRATLPNVERLELVGFCDAQPGQWQVLASGLPKLVHVSIPCFAFPSCEGILKAAAIARQSSVKAAAAAACHACGWR